MHSPTHKLVLFVVCNQIIKELSLNLLELSHDWEYENLLLHNKSLIVRQNYTMLSKKKLTVAIQFKLMEQKMFCLYSRYYF